MPEDSKDPLTTKQFQLITSPRLISWLGHRDLGESQHQRIRSTAIGVMSEVTIQLCFIFTLANCCLPNSIHEKVVHVIMCVSLIERHNLFLQNGSFCHFCLTQYLWVSLPSFRFRGWEDLAFLTSVARSPFPCLGGTHQGKEKRRGVWTSSGYVTWFLHIFGHFG